LGQEDFQPQEDLGFQSGGEREIPLAALTKSTVARSVWSARETGAAEAMLALERSPGCEQIRRQPEIRCEFRRATGQRFAQRRHRDEPRIPPRRAVRFQSPLQRSTELMAIALLGKK
jgi:hypothetical protein